MCHFAAIGKWNSVPPSEKQHEFFYIGNIRKYWKIIWKKCAPRFYGYAYSEDVVHYPEENQPRSLKKKPIKKNAEKSPRNLKSKPNKRIVHTMKRNPI